jgi:hypothetical protein
MPHSPLDILFSPFFPHACSHYVLRHYIVTPTLSTAQHHDLKDGRLSQPSECPLAKRTGNAALHVPYLDARVDSTTALRRRDN